MYTQKYGNSIQAKGTTVVHREKRREYTDKRDSTQSKGTAHSQKGWRTVKRDGTQSRAKS